MNILVIGGLGFIGSHTTIVLIKSKHSVIIADNLINSKIEERTFKTYAQPQSY